MTAIAGFAGLNTAWAKDLHPMQSTVNDKAPDSVNASSSSDWYHSVYIQDVRSKSHLRMYQYPQLHNLKNSGVASKLNAVLKTAGTPRPSYPHDSIQSSYSVLMQRGPFMEIMMSSYDYPQGAAHGMPVQTALMMNLSDGTVYRIGNLFQSGSKYLARLSADVRSQDKTHELDSFEKFKGVTAHDGFYLSNNGVTVFFSPYEWTPYAYGFPTFTVPFAHLSGIIDHTSPMWRAFQNPLAVAAGKDEQTDLRKIGSLGYVPLSDPTLSFAQSGTPQHQYLYVWDAQPKQVQSGSVQKLFFFLGTRYLGTDTWRDHGPVYGLTPTGYGTVSATYLGNTGQKDFTIAFHWNGKKMELTPAFPSSYSLWSNQ